MSFFGSLEPVAISILEILSSTLIPGIALVMVLGICLRVFRKINASTRYLAWLAALVLILSVPATTNLDWPSIQLPKTEEAIAQFNPQHEPLPDESIHIGGADFQSIPGAVSASEELPSTTLAPVTLVQEISPEFIAHSETAELEAMAITEKAKVFISLPDHFALYVFGLWALISSAILVRLFLGYLGIRKLRRKAYVLDRGLQQRVDRISSVQQRIRPTFIRVSNRISTPMAIGLLNPMILLPESLVDQLSAEELDQVVLHELSHIRRFDDWGNLIQRIAHALLFFHPAIWWINRQLNLEREIACDDYVLSMQSEDSHSYASSLIKVAKHAHRPALLIAKSASMMAKTQIEKRIGLILNGKRLISTQVYRASLILLFVVLSASIGILGQISPEFAITKSQSTSAPTPANLVADLPANQYLYWFNVESAQGPDVIQKINLEANQIQDIVTISRESNIDLGLHPNAFKTGDRGKVFATESNFYWSDPLTNSIHRTNTDPASEIEQLVRADSNITALFVNEIDSQIYWATGHGDDANSHGTLLRSSLDGSSIEILSDRPGSITDLELDAENNMLYWSENEVFDQPRAYQSGFNNGSIYRMNLISGVIERKISSVGIVTSFELDLTNERIFWGQLSDPSLFTNLSPSMIIAASLDGLNREPIVRLAQGPTLEQFNNVAQNNRELVWSQGLGPFDLELDVASEKIYWSVRGSHLPAIPGKIERSNLDGSSRENVVIGLENPHGIVLSSTDFNASISLVEASGTSSPSAIFNSYNSNLYWIEGYSPKIRRADLNGNIGEELYTPHLTKSMFQSYTGCMYRSTDSVLAVNDGQVVYSGYEDRLSLIDFDAGSVKFHAREAHNHALHSHVVIDHENGLVYNIRMDEIQSENGSTIYRYEIYSTDLNGANESIVYQGEGHGIGLALDPINNVLYWSENHINTSHDGHESYETIFRRAKLNGATAQELFMISNSYVSQVKFDYMNQSLIVKNLKNLESYNVYGHSKQVLHSDRCAGSNKFAIHDFDLDLEQNMIYAVDTALGTIARMHTDGSGFEAVVEDLHVPVGIAIDNDLDEIRKRISSLSRLNTSTRGGGGSSP